MIKTFFKPDDGMGGGITNKKNSYHNTLFMADFMIALTRDTDSPKERYIKVIKNRSGANGKATPEMTVDLSSRMIAMSIFGDTSLKLFRVDLEESIKEAITETIMNKLGDAHDPFRTKSTGDGS